VKDIYIANVLVDSNRTSSSVRKRSTSLATLTVLPTYIDGRELFYIVWQTL